MKCARAATFISVFIFIAYCQVAAADATPRFSLGFKALADQIPDIVGQPIENEHYMANGDSIQRTTTGMMVWRKLDNLAAFTDGSRTWINGPAGVECRDNSQRFEWELPLTNVYDPSLLSANKSRIAAGDESLQPALSALKSAARRALSEGPFSVVDKAIAPPSGDKHDYYSLAPYYWPNPDSADGLPYVERDGQVNPELATKYVDASRQERMLEAVNTLALAYYFTGDEQYASWASALVRTWFIDPATRMNPNLEYAQVTPGSNGEKGTPWGIIENRDYSLLVDSLAMLSPSQSWTAADDAAMKGWMGDYYRWLTESEIGRAARDTKNNHGTWYDVQVSAIALYLGKADDAIRVVEEAKDRRIAAQIEPDGRQPKELARTNGWSYSSFNLEAFVRLALIGERMGIDLWNYRTSDGRWIRGALDYLLPFASNPPSWPHEQAASWSNRIVATSARIGAAKYGLQQYRQIANDLEGSGYESSLSRLVYP
jgi:hypothetical protein